MRYFLALLVLLPGLAFAGEQTRIEWGGQAPATINDTTRECTGLQARVDWGNFNIYFTTGILTPQRVPAMVTDTSVTCAQAPTSTPAEAVEDPGVFWFF